LLAALFAAGCGSATWLRNGLLDPTQVGQFQETRRNEIRHTLSLLEEPPGLQNVEEPTAEDMLPNIEQQRIGPGDAVSISVYELLTPGVMTTMDLRIGNSGFETLPMLGPVRVVGLTPRELELEIKQRLHEAEILDEAEVQAILLASQATQCSVVGNVFRPGTYPLAHPEVRLLDIIAAAGGIPPTTEQILVFRKSPGQPLSPPAAKEETPAEEQAALPVAGARGSLSVAKARTKSAWPYTLSEVSAIRCGTGVSPVFAASGGTPVPQPPPETSRPTTEEGGEAAEEMPGGVPDWDEERGEWVIREAPAAQPATTGTAPAAPEVEAEAPERAASRPGSAPQPEGEPVESAWEGEEELGPPLRIIEIPVKELMEGDPRYNIAMRPYDLVNVPPGNVGEFFLMGNVARPGAYTLTGRRLTVKEAVASAGGFGPLAWPSRADLVRRVTEDEEQIIQLDLDAIFAGDAPDFYVKPSDIVNIGTNPATVFFAVLRNAFRFSYGMGFVYDRNFGDGDTFQAQEQLKQRRDYERAQRGLPF
jgi:polysaccharide export outer membrane protein